MNLPEEIPLIAFRPQIKQWFERNKESQEFKRKKEIQGSIAKNRTTYFHFIRQVKKAQRASGVANEDFLPWLKFMVELIESEIND